MGLKLHFVTLLFIMTVTGVICQNASKIDTSYTVYSAFNKYVKKIPNIEIVKAQTFENVVEEKEIVYKEIGDRKLHLDAFYDTNKALKPAVILIHGGGWKSGNKSLMEPLAQNIASKGYACFTIEYRLSLEALFPEGILDIKSAIQFVKENAGTFYVDTTKVAILGGSSGGQMAALVGTTNNNPTFEDVKSNYKHSSSVQAIVDIDGILAFKHPESEEDYVASLWLGGNYEEKPNVWEEASALTHADQNTPPILFIGSQYPRFLAGRDDMIKILDQYGIYSQVEIFENSPHSFWLFHPWFNETVAYIVAFLNKNLK